MEKHTTTKAEQFSIAEWRMEFAKRQAWAEGYAAGAEYIIGAMIRSRVLSGNWRISDDLTELVRVEGQ